MPIKTLVPKHTVSYDVLSEQLRTEWMSPNEDITAPVIIASNDPLRPQVTPQHLYVIWDAWSAISPRERSEMIMSAYSEVKGREMALNVTLAMGLTHEEAKRLNIQYQ